MRARAFFVGGSRGMSQKGHFLWESSKGSGKKLKVDDGDGTPRTFEGKVRRAHFLGKSRAMPKKAY